MCRATSRYYVLVLHECYAAARRNGQHPQQRRRRAAADRARCRACGTTLDTAFIVVYMSAQQAGRYGVGKSAP